MFLRGTIHLRETECKKKRYFTPTNKQEFCPSQNHLHFIKKLLHPLLIICASGTWVNSLSESKTPVHALEQPDCNLSTLTRNKELYQDTRGKMVHLHRTGMSQTTTGEQPGEMRATVDGITRQWNKYKISLCAVLMIWTTLGKLVTIGYYW